MAPDILRPGAVLFGVNSSGRVFSLCKDEREWRELEYLGVEFKRISASRNVVWAVGGDHQVYVFVFGLEVPVKVNEVTYENERWNPMEGFSSNLLPTDRPNWSNKEGTVGRKREDVHLPTMAWAWEDEWHLDTLFNGVQLSMGGWTYAMDFPAEYHPKKGFTSCVRRRKWIRHRKYVARSSWSAVPGLHRDSGEEPFIDISVGGHEMPGGKDEELVVWTVTVAGRVMYRQGVTHTCPEGTGWLHITTPVGKEVNQLSVSPSGLVWAVTWQGSALVRLGVNALEPSGRRWCEVEQPRPEYPLSVVAVGENIVWVVTRGGGVWFRQGVRSETGGQEGGEQLAKGNRWIQMVGEVSMLSIGCSDQVLAVGDGDRPVLVRSGVTQSDLSGKTWKIVTAPVSFQDGIKARRTRSESTASSSYENEYSNYRNRPIEDSVETTEDIMVDENKNDGPGFGDRILERTERGLVGIAVGGVAQATLGRVPIVGPLVAGVVKKAVMEEVEKNDLVGLMKKKIDITNFGDDKENIGDNDVAVKNASQSNIDESLYQSTLETLNEGEDMFLESEIEEKSSSIGGQLIIDWESQYHDQPNSVNQGEPHWVWVTLGSCSLDNQLPSQWFIDQKVDTMSLASMASLSVDVEEQWRKDLLLQLLREKGRMEGEEFKDYQSAIESSSWVKKSLVRVNLGGKGGRWEQVNLELEQHGTKEGQVDFGTLSMFGQKTSIKEHISLSEISCISICSEKCSPQIAVFTARRSTKMRPILIKFPSEVEMNDWHGELLQGMNSVHGTFARPSSSSVFSVTARGEVMVFDPEAAGKRGEEQNTTVSRQYSQEIEVDGHTPPFSERLDNGFGAGSSLYWEIRIGDTCTTFAINLQFGDGGDPDTSLHFNPRLTANHIVLNSKDDAGWGNEEKQPLVVMTGEGTAIRAFSQGSTVQLVVKAEKEKYEIFVNGVKFATYKYRKGLSGGGVTHVKLVGDVIPIKLIYSSKSVILPPTEMYWRSLGGGHLLMVESCPVGVVWSLGYDSTAWVYSGGWGGHPGCKSGSSFGVGHMSDLKYFYIYENQRWNPVTGFSATGLPTDRHMWSDKSGLHQATKESVRLPGGGWMWVGDWMVDHHTPGGTDKDGWQFATDFPASYHSSQTFTDYVRRRRWARKCRLAASGPWTELGTTKLLDISLQPYNYVEETIRCWAVATNGEALYRMGVTSQTPGGEGWSHVRSDNLFQAVTVGGDGNVWLVSNEGHVYLRHGVESSCPGGLIWVQVQNPDINSKFRSVEGGSGGSVWALDTQARLWLRRGISVQYPEGTSWTLVSSAVRSMSHGMGDLWAVLEDCQGVSGVLARRGGVTPSTPCGDGWEVSVGGGWRHVSVRGWVK